MGLGEEDGDGLTQDGVGSGTGAGACFQDAGGVCLLADAEVGLAHDEVEAEETAETGDGEGLGLGAMAGLAVTISLGASAGLGATVGLGWGWGLGAAAGVGAVRLPGGAGGGAPPFWRLSAAMRSLREVKWGSSSDIVALSTASEDRDEKCRERRW